MTRNYAISLPQHPPGPPSITQPSTQTQRSADFKAPPTIIQLPQTFRQTLHRQLTVTTLCYTSAIIPLKYHQRPLSGF